jgi:hypothetical protein
MPEGDPRVKTPSPMRNIFPTEEKYFLVTTQIFEFQGEIFRGREIGDKPLHELCQNRNEPRRLRACREQSTSDHRFAPKYPVSNN